MKRLTALAVFFAALSLAQMQVVVTYYWPTPEQTDANPLVGSCGHVNDWKKRLFPGEYLVALSRDLFFEDGRKRCGLIVHITLKDGTTITGVVWDTMAARWQRRVDVLYPYGVRPKWGKTKGVLEEKEVRR